jgi:hypothetical protein
MPETVEHNSADAILARDGSSVPRDSELAVQNPPPSSDVPAPGTDPKVSPIVCETPSNGVDIGLRQEMQKLREEQSAWMQTMATQMKDFMTGQSKVNSPIDRKTRSNNNNNSQ